MNKYDSYLGKNRVFAAILNETYKRCIISCLNLFSLKPCCLIKLFRTIRLVPNSSVILGLNDAAVLLAYLYEDQLVL